MSPPSLRGRKCGGPESGDRLGWVVLAGPPIPISRPEGAPPHRAVPGSTTWAATERDCSACRAAGKPELGGVSEGFPRKDSRAGIPTRDATSGSVPNLRT